MKSGRHRFRRGWHFSLHQKFRRPQKFRRVPKFRQSKSRKEKRECQSLFLRYSVLDNGFFCPSLLARAERRICICLQRRKCLKKHTNFVKYANHEVTEFWTCKKWARTVLAFLSLQKIEWKLVNSSNVIYICFADAKTVWKSTNSLFASSWKAETPWFDCFSLQVKECLKHGFQKMFKSWTFRSWSLQKVKLYDFMCFELTKIEWCQEIDL